MGYFFVRVRDVTGVFFFGCRNGSPVADALLSYCVHSSSLITGSSGSTVVLACIQVEANTEFCISHDANSCLRTRQWDNNIVENNVLSYFDILYTMTLYSLQFISLFLFLCLLLTS